MARPTFKQFIRTAETTNDIEGDLIGDLRGDKGVPHVTTAAGLREYIESHGACEGALDAVAGVWKRYERRADLFEMFG